LRVSIQRRGRPLCYHFSETKIQHVEGGTSEYCSTLGAGLSQDAECGGIGAEAAGGSQDSGKLRGIRRQPEDFRPLGDEFMHCGAHVELSEYIDT